MRWLAYKGKIEEGKQVLKQIAKANKKTVNDGFYEEFEEMVKREMQQAKEEDKVNWLDLFKTPRLRRNSILIIITW